MVSKLLPALSDRLTGVEWLPPNSLLLDKTNNRSSWFLIRNLWLKNLNEYESICSYSNSFLMMTNTNHCYIPKCVGPTVLWHEQKLSRNEWDLAMHALGFSDIHFVKSGKKTLSFLFQHILWKVAITLSFLSKMQLFNTTNCCQGETFANSIPVSKWAALCAFGYYKKVHFWNR